MPLTRSATDRKNACRSGASHMRCAANSPSSRAWVGGYIGPMMTISGLPPAPGAEAIDSAVGGAARRPFFLDDQAVRRRLLDRLGGLDLDAEPGDADIG